MIILESNNINNNIIFENFISDIADKIGLSINQIKELFDTNDAQKKFNDKINNAVKTVPTKIKSIENKIEQSGISVKHIHEVIDQTIKEHKEKILNKKININDLLKSFQKKLHNEYKENPISTSISICICILFIEGVFRVVLMMFIGPREAHQITSIFIEPFVEEIGKYMSVNKDATGTFFIIFNTYQFIKWVILLISYGVTAPAAILIRLTVLLMNAETTFWHYHVRNDPNVVRGFILGLNIVFHMMWNESLGHNVMNYILDLFNVSMR